MQIRPQITVFCAYSDLKLGLFSFYRRTECILFHTSSNQTNIFTTSRNSASFAFVSIHLQWYFSPWEKLKVARLIWLWKKLLKQPGLSHNCGFSHLMVLIGKSVKSAAIAALLSYREFSHYEQVFIQKMMKTNLFFLWWEKWANLVLRKEKRYVWWLPPKQNRSDLQLFGIQFLSVQRGATEHLEPTPWSNPNTLHQECRFW